jgi:hypothetical protein
MVTVPAVAVSNRSVASLLGGPGVLHSKPRTPLDWVSLIRKGLALEAADSLANTPRVTQSELGAALAIPNALWPGEFRFRREAQRPSIPESPPAVASP